MEMRVEQLSAQAAVPVDTIRYYQSKGILEPPRRQGRIAWYGDGHLVRLRRIRSLQQRGFTLATIARLVSGELDAADEALLGQLSGFPPAGTGGAGPTAGPTVPDRVGAGDGAGAPGVPASGPGVPDGDGASYTLAGLAEATGIPLALLKAIEAEGLLIPTRVAGQERYTPDDVDAARAGLLMLEWGIPLPDLLDLARRHNEATEEVARTAVDLFARHVREPLRHGARPDALDHPSAGLPVHATGDPAVDDLVQAYAELLPAVTTLVGHHFTRTLVKVALAHVEQVGSDEERRAVWDRLEGEGVDHAPSGSPSRSSAGSAVRG